MAENPEDYRRLLDDAIGSAPASNIDLDAVISGERRKSRRQNAAAGASAAVVLAVIGLSVAALLPGRDAPEAAHRGSAPAAAPTTRPSAPRTTSTTPGPPSPATTSASLSPSQALRFWPDLKHSLTKMVPDAKPLPPQQCGPDSPAGSPLTICDQTGQNSALATVRAGFGAREPYYLAAADVPAADGTRGLFIIIQHAGSQSPCPSSVPSSRCSTSIGPDGEQVMSITDLTTPGMPANASMNVVSVWHADGTQVIATAQNWPASADSIGTIEVKHPPAAVQQLREIAITPEISLTH